MTEPSPALTVRELMDILAEYDPEAKVQVATIIPSVSGVIAYHHVGSVGVLACIDPLTPVLNLGDCVSTS